MTVDTHVKTLRTGRLVMRLPEERDIEPIFQACQDPLIQRFTLVPVPYRRSDAEWLVRVNAPNPASATWSIEAADGHLAGTIGVSLKGDGSGSVGYWCAPADRGNGYLGEALHAVVEHAFDDEDGLGLRRVTWRALCDNVVSARMAAAAGFRYTGVRTDNLRDGDERMHTAELWAADDRSPQIWPADVVGISKSGA